MAISENFQERKTIVFIGLTADFFREIMKDNKQWNKYSKPLRVCQLQKKKKQMNRNVAKMNFQN